MSRSVETRARLSAAMLRRSATPDAFWRLVTKTTEGCWAWGSAPSNRYVHVIRSGRPILAHRYAYQLAKGPIPEGLTIDHLCRNRRCVRPDHLEAVPMRVNVLRGNGPTAINARKTHCKHGHAFSPDNIRPDPRFPGSRQCKTCARISTREQGIRRRARPDYVDRRKTCQCGHRYGIHSKGRACLASDSERPGGFCGCHAWTQ